MYLIELSDKRNKFLYEKLKPQYEARPYTDENAQNCGASTVIVFSPTKKLAGTEAEKLPRGITVLGGKQADDVLKTLGTNGINYINLLSDEIYAVKNAVLTAECALRILIGATEKSIYKNNILILGCGRVGKAVALLLDKFGLNIAVCTFDKAEYTAASLYARQAYFGESFIPELPLFDVIINTVPAVILNEKAVNKIAAGTAIVELASVPCLNAEKIKESPLKYIPAPGLPAQYCPETAAEIMLECVLRQKQ